MTKVNIHKILFTIFLIILKIKNIQLQNSFCNNVIHVKLSSPKWRGDLEVHTQLVGDGINLDLVFKEGATVNPSSYIQLFIPDRETLNVNLLANYDSNNIPYLREIQLNGKNICRQSSAYQIAPKPTITPTRKPSQQYYSPPKTTIPTTRTTTRSPFSAFQYYPQPTVPRRTTKTTTTTTASPYSDGFYYKPTYGETNPEFIPNICGIVVPELIPFIYNGRVTTSREFPWHAAIFYYSPNQYTYHCGGSLIADDTVLTAAHCVLFLDTFKVIPAENLVLYLGKDFLHKYTPVEQNSRASKVIVNPNFNPQNFNGDIAIIKLKKKVEVTNYVSPVCLWRFGTGVESIIHRNGLIAGFGYNEQGSLTEPLTSVAMPVAKVEECLWSNRDFFSRFISEQSFCAGFRNGSSVCNGDSGGGMVFEENSLWYLRGIVSIGASDPKHKARCNVKDYILFTDVSQFIPWIEIYL